MFVWLFLNSWYQFVLHFLVYLNYIFYWIIKYSKSPVFAEEEHIFAVISTKIAVNLRLSWQYFFFAVKTCSHRHRTKTFLNLFFSLSFGRALSPFSASRRHKGGLALQSSPLFSRVSAALYLGQFRAHPFSCRREAHSNGSRAYFALRSFIEGRVFSERRGATEKSRLFVWMFWLGTVCGGLVNKKEADNIKFGGVVFFVKE